MNKIKFLFLLMFALSSTYNFAQEDFNGGSPYTVFGVGDNLYYSNNRTEGMSIMGIALTGDNVTSFNPAANYRLQHTELAFGFRYNFLRTKSDASQSDNTDANISGFNFGIPLQKDWGMVLNIGFNPSYQINYKVTRLSSQLGEPVTHIYAGNGGLSRINAGLSYTPVKNLSLGFEYNYSFGNIKKLAVLDFTDPNITSTYQRRENDLGGSFVKGGLVINIGRIFKELKADELSIGFVFQTKLKLSSTLDKIYGTSLGNDSTQVPGGDIEIPEMFGFGITNKFGDKYLLSGDVVFQQWANYKINGTPDPNLRNSMRVGLGLEILPNARPDRPFLVKNAYRFGVFYDKSLYSINGEGVDGYGASIGMGIPLNKFNSIDIALSYQTRGKTTNGLLKDDLLRISFGVNFGELWFLRPKDEDK
jgi:opacity protein-like surface antigen